MIRIYLLLFLLIFLGGVVWYFFFSSHRLGTQNASPVSSTFPLSQTHFKNSTVIPKSDFKIVKILPEDTTYEYLPIQQVDLVFAEPPRTPDLKYTVSPQVPTQVIGKKGQPNTLTISTTETWKEGITTITITGIRDYTFPKPYVYKLKTAFPKNPDLKE
ncbi:hypothetical protein HY384_00860 [Candidatus Daviesbacteria bacterium]|nr:hypothetical protein [Candidatus Daviesbacteria bacterium]